MAFVYLLEGILTGFFLAAPIGPAGIICIRRTLVHGRQEGFNVGLGGASADLVYAIVAAFGVTLISDFVNTQQQLIRLVGGILLMVVGLYSFRTRSMENPHPIKLNKHAVLWAIFFMGLTNPVTVFAYAAAFSAFGVKQAVNNFMDPFLLVGGVFHGSFHWFSLLTLLSHSFREKTTSSRLAIVDKVAGSLLVLLGAAAVWRGLA